MIRLDLLGRVMLILLGSVLLLGAGSVTLLMLREETKRSPITFPRLHQVAGTVDLLTRTQPSRYAMVLRAATGTDLTVKIVAVPPPLGDLRRAPRLEAQLRSFMATPAPIAAYVSPDFKPRRTAGRVEGFLARAVARLPDGRFASLNTNNGPDGEGPRLLRLPASLWMGGLAVVVALLALFLTAREMRPLRLLAQATRRFDGSDVTVQPLVHGAPDIRLTSVAVADMQARVVDLLGERSLMIGAISHDLRTLLTRMRLRTASLAEGDPRDGLERDLEGMDAMLADALAFARGTGASVRASLDLADVAATELAERDARPDEPVIAADLRDATCQGDRHALQRVIANLLDNAVKYGRGHIRLSVGGEGGEAWLTVEDNGPGIPADQRAVVLVPYHRGDDPKARRLAGSGLGLAIVQQIVRAHGGIVTISESTLGGAMVKVEIKCREPAAPERRQRRSTDMDGGRRLDGRVCVVAGVCGDMGEAVARRFAEEGGIVVGLDRRTHEIGTLALKVDLLDEAAIRQVYARLSGEFGRLDVLYNNLGPTDPDDHSALDTTLETWNRVIASVLTATWLSCKHAIPHMGTSATGSVINTASFLAGMGAATGQMAFNVAKAGVEQLSRDLGVHLARRTIRVNSIAVGPIETSEIAATFHRLGPEQTERRLARMPMGRFGTLQELAATAAYLASDDAGFVTSASFPLNGGIPGSFTVPEAPRA